MVLSRPQDLVVTGWGLPRGSFCSLQISPAEWRPNQHSPCIYLCYDLANKPARCNSKFQACDTATLTVHLALDPANLGQDVKRGGMSSQTSAKPALCAERG